MTKIYNIGIMTDEKNPNLNPQAEGSNAVFSRKGKNIIRYKNFEEVKNQLTPTQNNNQIIVNNFNFKQELSIILNKIEDIKVNEVSKTKIDTKVDKEVSKFMEKGENVFRRMKDEQVKEALTFGLFREKGEKGAAVKAAADFLLSINTRTKYVVEKLVNEAVNDLERQQKNLVKKTKRLIEERDKEEARNTQNIAKYERVIEELFNQNQDIKAETDEEISKLQEEIKKVVNQLKDYQEREKRLKEERARKLTKENIQKAKISEKDIKAPMTKSEDRIKELEHELEEMRYTAITFKESEEKRASELKDEQERHETTKTNLNNKITRKEEELKRAKIA
jgi:hypothetical protein